MTLQEYANHINSLAKKNPNLKVVYAIDDEGNRFQEVVFTPTVGEFDGHDFEPLGNVCRRANAVCVN